jgi:hypothetical protein
MTVNPLLSNPLVLNAALGPLIANVTCDPLVVNVQRYI